LALIDLSLGEVLDPFVRSRFESQMPIAGWSDPVDKVLWEGVLIFCTEVTSGYLRDRIHPHLKKKRLTDLFEDQFQSHHISKQDSWNTLGPCTKILKLI
jgi:hypothetical protein